MKNIVIPPIYLRIIVAAVIAVMLAGSKPFFLIHTHYPIPSWVGIVFAAVIGFLGSLYMFKKDVLAEEAGKAGKRVWRILAFMVPLVLVIPGTLLAALFDFELDWLARLGLLVEAFFFSALFAIVITKFGIWFWHRRKKGVAAYQYLSILDYVVMALTLVALVIFATSYSGFAFI